MIDIKSALITGITGQDGAYLAKFLLKKGYNVFGTFRRTSTPNFWRLSSLGIENDVNYISADLIDTPSLIEALKISKANEVYHLAAQSYVGSSFDQPVTSGEFSGLAVTRILESIRLVDPQIKFYQASSSEMYGFEKSFVKNESTPFDPISPYAVAKLHAYYLVRLYRNTFDMFAANGILFNHESPLRGLEFVTRKITNSVARIKLGLQKNLVLGNLKGLRDWGYAPEYVEGMWKILQQKKPDDYVLATNETHSVEEFAKEACKIAGIPYSVVKSSKKNFRPFDIKIQKGDYTKARKKLGWKPKTTFKELVKIMVESDIERLKS